LLMPAINRVGTAIAENHGSATGSASHAVKAAVLPSALLELQRGPPRGGGACAVWQVPLDRRLP
jgi:hypothetical protein